MGRVSRVSSVNTMKVDAPLLPGTKLSSQTCLTLVSGMKLIKLVKHFTLLTGLT